MKKVLAAMAVSAAAFAFGANAQDILLVHGFAPTLGGETVQRQVGLKVTSINPADKAGAAELFARIKRAADVVCAGGIGGKSDLLAAKVEKCRQETIALAVREVGSAELTAAAAAE